MNPYRRDTFLEGMLRKPEHFIGPQEELEWLLARVSEGRPTAVSMVGPLSIGKSVLLKFLAAPAGARQLFRRAIGARFADDPERLLFVLVDFEDRSVGPLDGHRLFDLLLAQTLGSLGEALGLPDGRSLPLERLPQGGQPSVAALGRLARRELELARHEADDDELGERLDRALGADPGGRLAGLLRRLDDWGLRAVFLFDNFDAVAPQLDLEAFDRLRELVGMASLVIATRKALSKLVPADVQLSPFFNLLEKLNPISLHFLSADAAERIVTEPPTWFAETAGFRFGEGDVRFILEIAGLHPDLIRTSCEYLYRWVAPRAAGQGDLLPPEEHTYLRARLRTPFTNFFDVLWHQLDRDKRRALAQIAAGATQPEFSPALRSLISDGYIAYERGQYRLFAGLFRDYVLDQGQAPAAPLAAPADLSLTDLEARLLELLRANIGGVVDRDEIFNVLYHTVPETAEDRQGYGRRLDALLFRLRDKLKREPLRIENARGQGYRLVETAVPK